MELKAEFEDLQSTYWKEKQGVITSVIFEKSRKKSAFQIWHSKNPI